LRPRFPVCGVGGSTVRMLCGNISIELTGPGGGAGDGCRNTIQNFNHSSTTRNYGGHLNGYVNYTRNKSDSAPEYGVANLLTKSCNTISYCATAMTPPTISK
jgi:hypothetical protein